MRAFLIGLVSLIALLILAGVGLLLYPFVIVLALFMQVILALLFVVFAIWLLGKFIIFVWEGIFHDKGAGDKQTDQK